MLASGEINLRGHESEVAKWRWREKGNKRSHFQDVYFAQSLQHKLWLHLVSRGWWNIRKRKKEILEKKEKGGNIRKMKREILEKKEKGGNIRKTKKEILEKGKRRKY